VSLEADIGDMKRRAAERALDDIEDGMVLGLGSGTTAAFALEALAPRIAAGLRVAGIPTSLSTAALARELGIPLTDFGEHRHIDLTIDGADQVERGTLSLIKGGGGAMLREKIVASASARMIVIVDETKLADRLGDATRLPVEIVTFGWQTVLERLEGLELAPQLRRIGGQPFVTDGGNHIADCVFPAGMDPRDLEDRLARIVGVIECGLFIGLASKVIVGHAESEEVMEP